MRITFLERTLEINLATPFEERDGLLSERCIIVIKRLHNQSDNLTFAFYRLRY